MATENEPAKLLLPYLQRADELQKHEPLVAYYCRLYAMERGLKIPQSDRTKTTNSLLVSLMKQLEKDKKSLKLGPDDHLHVEGFASNVFSRADKQDRAERADLNTAKTFYAASIFFEILNQFGELQPDLEEKQKYAVWKAADIRKALKEGRKPLPGPPGGGNKDPSEPSSAEYRDFDLEPRGSSFTTTTIPDPTRVDLGARTQPDQSYNQDKNNVNRQQPTSFSRQTSNVSDSPPTIPDHNYPPNTFHQPPPPTNNTSEHQHSIYHHQYNPEPSQHFPPQDSYPNFQSYPSSTESGLPTHYPSFYQPNPNPNTSQYVPTPAQYGNYNSRNEESFSDVSPVKYEYDSRYQPPPEKITEAHKAAKFAVGALAFDDVSIAVDYLKKSLELLTNPSASH